jgi:carboxyl-terminal processing protease
MAALADQLLDQIAKEEVENVWEAVNRLVRVGKASGTITTDKLAERLTAPDQKIQLACARALCQLSNTERATPVLLELATKGQTPTLRRLAANAVGLTASLAGNQKVIDTLAAAVKAETDGLTKVSLARSLWYIGPHADGREALLSIVNNGADKNIKDEAALVLAENGAVKVDPVRQRLLNLYNEPTAQGERARNIMRNAEENSLAPGETGMSRGDVLMHEILIKIKAAYPDASRCEIDKLFEDAAKGMVGGLDPFSQYLDRDEVKATQEMLAQDYGGIGAYIGQKNGSYFVISPIYGSPAHRAGLRARDVIVEVDGHKASEVGERGGVTAIVSRLKGKPGTPVQLKYSRRGQPKPVEVTIVRDNIRVESVCCDLLPGDIAYVRLTRFGEHSAEEMQKALDEVLTQKKARGLIFDLRDNPGGLLKAGVEIADKFLAGGKLIVYSEGNKEFAPRKDFYSSGGPEKENYPMVCLVGAGSASASEIVAGALQDHKRAALIGERTYGKGSVQQIMPLRATSQETQLRLTIARYFLPSGRCIHEKGVDVDVEVKAPAPAEAPITAKQQNLIEDYVRTNWESNKETLLKLARNDDCKCENWPKFDELYKDLHTPLHRDDIRIEARKLARWRLEDEQKKQLACDVESDDVVQRGVLELLNKLNVDPATIAEYKSLPAKFAPATEGAMLPPSEPRP